MFDLSEVAKLNKVGNVTGFSWMKSRCIVCESLLSFCLLKFLYFELEFTEQKQIADNICWYYCRRCVMPSNRVSFFIIVSLYCHLDEAVSFICTTSSLQQNCFPSHISGGKLTISPFHIFTTFVPNSPFNYFQISNLCYVLKDMTIFYIQFKLWKCLL